MKRIKLPTGVICEHQQNVNGATQINVLDIPVVYEGNHITNFIFKKILDNKVFDEVIPEDIIGITAQYQQYKINFYVRYSESYDLQIEEFGYKTNNEWCNACQV